MRLRLAAAALAALVLATPAAAQSRALDVMRGATSRLAANSEGVRDYTLTLRSGTMATDVYVYRDGDDWEVAAPESEDDPIGGMLKGLVVWPSFGGLNAEFPAADQVSAEDLAQFEGLFNLSTETVGGRPADVLFIRLDELMEHVGGDSEMPDSVRLYLDPESHQIVRVAVAGEASELGELGAAGGTMQVNMDFADYRETDGLTIPHSLRMAMDVDLQLTDEQRTGMRAGIEYARTQMQGDDSPEAQQAAAMIDLFIGLLTEGHMELPVTVENVRVNTGPPSWFEN